MRSVCLCEKVETMTAMRLGGIEGIVITGKEEAEEKFDALLGDPEVALVMLSENIVGLIEARVTKAKLEQKETLIIMIPEPEGLRDKAYIMKAIKESVGIKL